MFLFSIKSGNRTHLLFGPLNVVVDGVSKQLFGRLPEEGHAADEELVEDHAHRPPVHGLAVALPQDDLGGDVLRGAEDLESGYFVILDRYAYKREPWLIRDVNLAYLHML